MNKFLLALFVVQVLLPQKGIAQNGVIWNIPLGGNSWVHATSANAPDTVTEAGWQHWQDADAVWTTYLKLQKPGSLHLKALLHVPGGKSKLSFSIGSVTHDIEVAGAADKLYDIGHWDIIGAGYIKIEARGKTKTGKLFADVKELRVEGTAVDSQTVFVKSNEDNYFYWGRRGPSVHINYEMPAGISEAEWFYNEITVPEGNDVIGSYFMANGFGEGYFGMQVNSATERRIIFSVWSPFETDDPKKIPADKKIILLKKGNNVVAEDFGNEGSGGHSHLVYNWLAGQPCRFLLHAKPAEKNASDYTAYFFDTHQNKWLLIASFKRPATHTYLKKLHSFLENFEPETGDRTRKAFYHDQWIRPPGGDWVPLSSMKFTADATARKGFRQDYDGGVENGMFFLQNAGFFNKTGELNKRFMLEPWQQKPVIDSDLPEK